MEEALLEAEKARAIGEVPIGCIIEKDGEIVGRGFNKVESLKDPTAHAEMEAIRMATRKIGWARLKGCNMYVTLEPCSMCAGAIVLSRIDRLYIGAMDPKSGGCGSVFNIVEEPKLNHRVEVIRGVEKERCENILKEFFADLRKGNGGKNR